MDADFIISNIWKLKTCGICKKECCNPKTLECLHNFCLDCLERFISDHTENESYSCPTCKLKIVSPTSSSTDNSFLESLKPNALFEDYPLSTVARNGLIACKVHPRYACYYYYSDSFELACDVCKSNRLEYCERLTDKAMKDCLKRQHERVNKSLSNIKCELRNICGKLNTRERQLSSENNETVLGILKYFADLKIKIDEYLTKHENEILEKLRTLNSNAMSTVKQASLNCLALLESLNSKFSFIPDIPLDREHSASTSYVGLQVLQAHIQEYSAKARIVKDQTREEPELRFIINTEFEDMLTGGDLIDIEVIETGNRHEAGRRSTIQADNLTANTNPSSRPNSSVESTCVTDAIAITVSPPTEAVDIGIIDNEPPPPYPGITQNDNSIDSLLPVLPNRFSQPGFCVSHNLPTAPSFEDVMIPVVPRGLTQVRQQPITLSGTLTESHILSFQPITEFSIARQAYDRKNPSLSEVYWIDKHAILALDKRNQSLKVFSNDGTLLNLFNLRREPYGCTVYKLPSYRLEYITVSFPKHKKLSVFSVNKNNNFQIEFEKNIVTTKGYTCITFSEKLMAFVCGTTHPFALPSVDIVSYQGQVMRSFNGSNVVRFGYPRSVRVNSHGIIAVSDYKTSRMLVINDDGNHEFVFDGSDRRKLTDPQGIGIYDKLNLFVVCETRLNRIYFVDQNGIAVDEISQDRLTVMNPRFVDFSCNSTMAVGHGNGFLSLYEVIDDI